MNTSQETANKKISDGFSIARMHTLKIRAAAEAACNAINESLGDPVSLMEIAKDYSEILNRALDDLEKLVNETIH